MIQHTLKLESLAIFLASLYFYDAIGESWLLFGLVWLVPDVFMVGYLKSPKVGAITYNVAHNYVGPSAIAVVGFATEHTVIMSLAVIWFSHVSLDRFLGYGLKKDSGFEHTHLGTIGKTGTKK